MPLLRPASKPKNGSYFKALLLLSVHSWSMLDENLWPVAAKSLIGLAS
jgi:hypothetical protein